MVAYRSASLIQKRNEFTKILFLFLNLFIVSLTYGCSDNDIDKVKSGILGDIDKTTTVGKAVDGYQYFQNVKWKSATDKQGRRFVFFDAEFNDKVVSSIKEQIHREFYDKAKIKNEEDTIYMSEKISQLQKNIDLNVDDYNKALKNYTYIIYIMKNVVNEYESASTRDDVYAIDNKIQDMYKYEFGRIGGAYDHIMEANKIIEEGRRSNNKTYIAIGTGNMAEQKNIIAKEKVKIYDDMLNKKTKLDAQYNEIVSMSASLKNMNVELSNKKQREISILDCVSKIPDSLKFGKIMYHQEFIIVGNRFAAGSSFATIYDEHGNPLGEKTLFEVDPLVILYMNQAPAFYKLPQVLLPLLEQSVKKCTEAVPTPVSQSVQEPQALVTPAPAAPTPTPSASTQQPNQPSAPNQPATAQSPTASAVVSSSSSKPVETPPAQPQDSLRSFVEKIFSVADATGLSILQKSYADTVDFYGKQTSNGDIMKEKLAFYKKWPTATYTLKSYDVQDTDDKNVKQVSCTVEFHAKNDSKTVGGLSMYTLGVRTSGSAPVIVKEIAKVIQRY